VCDVISLRLRQHRHRRPPLRTALIRRGRVANFIIGN
jgi:hypothetical protein